MRPPSNVYDVSNVLCVVYLHIGETTVTRQSAFFWGRCYLRTIVQWRECSLRVRYDNCVGFGMLFFAPKPCHGHFTVINIKIPNTY